MSENPFVTDIQPVCPTHLLELAARFKPTRTAIASAGFPLPMRSAHHAFEAGILEPVFVGNKNSINAEAEELGWDIAGFEIIEAESEKQCARASALLGRERKVASIMKGHLHTDEFMKAMISHKVGIRIAKRFYHLFYISEPESGQPLIISDAAVNVSPTIETRKALLVHIDKLARATGINRPRIAILSATESEIKTVPSSLEAAELCRWAKDNLPTSDVSGPLAFDLVLSARAAKIKNIKNNPVAGAADAVLVPDIVSGNVLFKALVYLGGGCAGGIVMGGNVPVLLTSRADAPAARLASCALASIVANSPGYGASV
ncbi:MAG: bifunctional enoyl-CoA hydratase/phosphate acetyltransferase [Rhizobiaceae bacterium]|nr:bifunctional enoyl-CoA hydratase/phosphate acetyltransferase [Rhizobiaceae bacterium]